MADETSYGWAGKILRVNLSTGSITTQPTDPYKEYIGGMGLANKIMYDEVPAGTDPFSPENKLIFAVGPLTASGVPLAGRTTICSLSTFTKDHLVVDAHCGGMIGAKIKLAGWDAVVLEGASDHPVYLNIVDDKVEIKDAGFVWGMGTRETTEMLCRKEGVEACVAAIGPAGENLLPYACIINARNHSAGAGTGSVMGSKNVKALVVQGNGSVNVKDPQAVADLSDYMLREVIGSNNNHVVPQTQQEWARPDGAGNERQPAEHHAHFGGGPGHGVPVAVARLEVGHPGHADEEEAHEGPPRQRQVRVENLLHQSHRLLDRRIPIDKHLTGRHEHAAEHGAGEHPCVLHEIIRLLKRQRGRGQARRQGTRRQRPRRCRAMIPRLRAALR